MWQAENLPEAAKNNLLIGALACRTTTQLMVLFNVFYGKIERKMNTMQERKKVDVVNDKAFLT